MDKDNRYTVVKDLYAAKRIESFHQIFDYIPKTVVAEDIGTSAKRMTRLIEAPHTFTAEEIYLMSELFSIPLDKLYMLVMQHYIHHKKKQRSFY